MYDVCDYFCNFGAKFSRLKMKRIRKTVIAMVGFVLASHLVLTNTACMNKELYDPDIVDTIMTEASPVDKIDTTHTWVLTNHSVYTITANVSVNAQKLQILTENPRESGSATVVSQVDITDGATVTLAASYPSLKTTLYAALVDAEGAYTVKAFSVTDRQVNFSSPAFTSEHLAYTPQPQAYAYCFEEEMPEPGDYDYNDIVLHISQLRVGDRVIQLDVQLAAVDLNYQVGAAIRLLDYSYEDIDSIVTVDGNIFNKNIPKQLLTVVTKDVDKLLLKGREGEAVVNLFADAHWATGDNLTENYGVITRKKYNVSRGSDGKSQLIVPRTISYLIYFKDGSQLNQFTMDSLDPFMIKPYAGANWEIHLNEYRFAQTLYEYTMNDLKNKHLPWVLKIPTGEFRHPLSGVNIGFYIKDRDILFGAYATRNHAFGNWTTDMTQAQDWYLYPQSGQVF